MFQKFLYHEFKEINVQFVESKSNTDFPDKVQVKVGLRELKNIGFNCPSLSKIG